MKNLLITLVCLLCITCIAQSQTQLWNVPLDFVAADYNVDATGNVVVTGKHMTRKYDAAGNELWRVPYGGWLVLTTNGDVYVKDDSLYEGGQFTFHKFSAQGTPLWSVEDYSIMGPYSIVSVDPTGNVFIFPPGWFESGSIPLLRLSPNRDVTRVGSVPEELDQKARELKVDAQMNCYLLVSTGTWANPDSVGVMRIGADGSIPWRYMFATGEHHEIPQGSYIDYHDVSSDQFRLTVDPKGNCYLYTNVYTEHNIIDPSTGYYILGSNIIKSRIEFVSSTGRHKSTGINGTGKVRISYVDNRVRYTEVYVENVLYDLSVSPQGYVYAYGYIDNRRWRRNPGFLNQYTGAFSYYVQRFRSGTANRQWRKVFFKLTDSPQTRKPDDVTAMDLSGNLYVPLFLQTGCYDCYDSLNFYRFAPNGTVGLSNRWSSQEWYKTRRRIQFDESGNLYALVVSSGDETQKSLVKYAAFSLGNPVTIPGFTDAETSTQPTVFALHQNFPNPFNPQTTIEFELSSDAIVTVKVFNTLGQEVATLAENEEFGTGQNELEFDGVSLPSGVYYYHITAEDVDGKGILYSNIKKMILVK